MAYVETIVGKYVDLCCVAPEDAEFTLAIRQDPEFSKYLPSFDNTIEQQIEWINKQREMEDDFFFVAWNKNGQRIGTVGVFGIKETPAKTGRLALKGNAFENIEAELLAFKFAFNNLNLDMLWGFIYAENYRAIRFAEQFGGILEDPQPDKSGRLIREVTFKKKNFEDATKRLSVMLYRERK